MFSLALRALAQIWMGLPLCTYFLNDEATFYLKCPSLTLHVCMFETFWAVETLFPRFRVGLYLAVRFVL